MRIKVIVVLKKEVSISLMRFELFLIPNGMC